MIFQGLIFRPDFLWRERTKTATFSKTETNETPIKIPKLFVREAVMDPNRNNHDWVNKYKLVAYRWKRRLVAKSGWFGISPVVCIYVCMYVSYVFYTNSWCPNRAYVGDEAALDYLPRQYAIILYKLMRRHILKNWKRIFYRKFISKQLFFLDIYSFFR